MTELIRSQLIIILTMLYCGLCAGLIADVFRAFAEIRSVRRWVKGVLGGVFFLCIGFLYGEFAFFCDNGKISFLGIFSFLAGLWLWKRFFCGILFMGEDNEKKEKQFKGIRKK